MGVPKRKRSRQRRDKRFANKGLKPQAVTACSNCQSPLATHQACLHCGFYKGAKVMTTKIERMVKRGKAQQAKVQRQKAQAPAASEAQE